MRGKSTLAYFLLALGPVLPVSMRRRIVHLARTLRPHSLDLIELDSQSGTLGEQERRQARASLRTALASKLIGHLQTRDSETGSAEEDFLRTALRVIHEHPKSVKAQLLQDAWALHASGCKSNGYFVEFGALDGVELSNTLLLEREYAWTGLLAEPNPRYELALRANRRAHVDTRCVWKHGGEKLQFADCGELGTVVGQGTEDAHAETRAQTARVIEVESVSLDELLISYHAPTAIDFMSVDTEGSELEILQAFSFDNREIGTMAIEHNFTSAERRLDDLLADHGYVRVFRSVSKWDAWYVPGRPS